MKLYACGQKQWVEVRRGRVLPRAIISTHRHRLSLSETDREAWLDAHFTRPPASTTLKQITFSGGRFIAAYKPRRFKALTGLSVKAGQVVEIPSPRHTALEVQYGQSHPSPASPPPPHSRTVAAPPEEAATP